MLRTEYKCNYIKEISNEKVIYLVNSEFEYIIILNNVNRGGSPLANKI